MIEIVKQKQPRVPISIVRTIVYMHGSYMVTIGKIPHSKSQIFFQTNQKQAGPIPNWSV